MGVENQLDAQLFSGGSDKADQPRLFCAHLSHLFGDVLHNNNTTALHLGSNLPIYYKEQDGLIDMPYLEVINISIIREAWWYSADYATEYQQLKPRSAVLRIHEKTAMLLLSLPHS